MIRLALILTGIMIFLFWQDSIAVASCNKEINNHAACSNRKNWIPEAEYINQVSNGMVVSPNLCNASIIGLGIPDKNFNNSDMRGANLYASNLFRASLQQSALNEVDFRHVIASEADFYCSTLNNSNLSDALLSRSNLSNADLTSADLSRAYLAGADLSTAILTRANLTGADLTGAILLDTKLTDAELRNVNLTGALYSPNRSPPIYNVAGLKGLRTVKFQRFLAHESYLLTEIGLHNEIDLGGYCYPLKYMYSIMLMIESSISKFRLRNNEVLDDDLSEMYFQVEGSETGLVELRDALQKSGLRDLEREATYAIERGRTERILHEAALRIDLSLAERVVYFAAHIARYILFDATIRYGLHPARSIQIIVSIWAILISVYYIPIRFLPKHSRAAAGIYRVWPADRIKSHFRGRVKITGEVIVERLNGRGLQALGRAAQFSLVSAFHIGWRDINVGTWISKIQTEDYTLRATGWVRVISGLQSLISVYLLALWVLSYFGRPFQ